MGLEINPKRWYWQQWVATFMLTIYLITSVTTPFIFLAKFQMKITLATFVITLVVIYNYLYFLGAFVELELKRYLMQMVVPLGLIVLELVLMKLLGNAIKVRIYWTGYLRYLITYVVMCLTFILGYRGIEYTTVYLTEKEVEELGINEP